MQIYERALEVAAMAEKYLAQLFLVEGYADTRQSFLTIYGYVAVICRIYCP